MTDYKTEINIVNDIRHANASEPGRPAVIEGGRVVSYGRLLKEVKLLRHELQKHGAGSGTRIAFCCNDGAAYIAGTLALLECGAAAVPVDISLPSSELQRLIDRIDVDGMLFETGTIPPDPNDEPLNIQIFGKKFTWRARSCAGPLPEKIRSLRPAFIRFSSGTTGASKGVMLSHRTIYERTEAANEALGIDKNDRVLWVLSMSHHFVVSILLFLRKGATIVVGHRNFPVSVRDAAMEGEITLIYASPLHYHLLVTDERVAPASLGNVRLAISTAMKLPSDTAHAFAGKFGFYPAEAYGIIEVGLPFINLAPSEKSIGSVGKILPAYELRIENPDKDGAGELLVRGRGVFDAYLSPLRFREEVLEDGWFRTGDIGFIAPGGNLKIIGRKKNVIICAGMKVFPEEVEELLDAHPAVGESLVCGNEHPVYGQIPVATIVLNSRGKANKTEALRRLRRYCYSALPSYSVPKDFTFADKLPKTASGKLLRR